ncbi:acetylornithine/succinylornithine family transaminase [bacterium]|nr:acetylornithine/succinylornithine family transaminase [bacterium]
MINNTNIQTDELEVYSRRNLVIVRGSGSRLWDENGDEYIDCVGGIGVASIGHANEFLRSALSDQAGRLISVSNLFYNDTRMLLAKKLTGIAPEYLNRVYLCNSGTETMEAAIKFARLSSGKTDFVCAKRGFHGRTMGALSATYKEQYKKPFEPLVPGFKFAEFNDLNAFINSVDTDTAGIIIEIIQGEGGIYPADQEFVQGLGRFCSENDILIIIDEVQTGIGRTGSMFAFEQYDIKPDIVTIAKGLGGGVPIGAVLVSDKIPKMPGKHGSTFGGNPLSCSAALAVIEFIESNALVREAGIKGDYFVSLIKSKRLPAVKEIRHRGLMIGIELTIPVKSIVLLMQRRGVLVLTAGENVIRLLPPLVITKEELKIAADVLESALESVQ